MSTVFRRRRPGLHDLCERCGRTVGRVWLVPGDVLNSCASCFEQQAGRPPVHGQGHSTAPPSLSGPRPSASFYLRADGRRPA